MSQVTKPIALDETFRTTDGNNTNIADVMSSLVSALKPSIVSVGNNIIYERIGDIVTANFSVSTITDGMATGLPSARANVIMLTLRDETIGGYCIVSMVGTGQINSAVGSINFVSGHNYSGSVSYIAN